MRALVVEDQRQMRTILRRMLQQMKYFQSIDEAEDGDTAWAKISPGGGSVEVYDFVLCDVNMPGLNGIGLLKRCRQHAALRFVPFIMISASSQGATVVSALGEWGANDFIVKPFSFELLRQRVGALIRRFQSPEESIYRQAETLKDQGKIEEALKLIEHWEIESRLSRAKWFNLKGECLAKKGDVEKAAVHYERAMGVSNIFLSAYKNYAEAHQQLGNIDKSIKALKHAEEISPTDEDRTLTLGRLLLQAGRDEEGKRYLDSLVKRTGSGGKEEALKKVAETYLDSGLYKEAEDTFLVVLRLNPGDIEASNRLGIALRQQGKYDEAERCYMKALKNNPDHPGIYHNLGILYMAQKSYDKARRCLLRALNIDPDFDSARNLLETVETKMKAAAAAEAQ